MLIKNEHSICLPRKAPFQRSQKTAKPNSLHHCRVGENDLRPTFSETGVVCAFRLLFTGYH